MNIALLSLALCMSAATSGRRAVEVVAHFRAGAALLERMDRLGSSAGCEAPDAAIDHTARSGRTPSAHDPVTLVPRPAAPGRVTLRVLSYNIHHGEGTDGKVDLPRLAAVIKACRPDLVALQEVDRNVRRSGSIDETAELARLTGLHGSFGKQIDYDGGEYGQAILSRFPITGMTVHWLPGTPERQRRIAVEARIVIEGKNVSFVTTHLHHINAEFRALQAAAINDLFGAAPQPVILAGDLNATPESKPLAVLGQRWVLPAAARPLATYPSAKPREKIDHILYRGAGHCRVVEEAVLDEAVASDHRALLVVLEGLPE